MDDIDPRMRDLEKLLHELHSEAAVHDSDALQWTSARAYASICQDSAREYEYLREAMDGLGALLTDDIEREIAVVGIVVRAYAVLEVHFKSVRYLLIYCREIEDAIGEREPIKPLVIGRKQLGIMSRNARAASREHRDVQWKEISSDLGALGVAVQLDEKTRDGLDRARRLRNQLAHGNAVSMNLVDADTAGRTVAVRTDCASDTGFDPESPADWDDAAVVVDACEAVIKEIDVAVSRNLFDEPPFMENLGDVWL